MDTLQLQALDARLDILSAALGSLARMLPPETALQASRELASIVAGRFDRRRIRQDVDAAMAADLATILEPLARA